MPSVKSFTQLFGLKVNTEIDNEISIIKYQIDHNRGKKGEYIFNITIIIKIKGEMNEQISKEVLPRFLDYLNKTGGQDGRIMHTSYGTPYDCAIGTVIVKSIIEDQVILESIGNCTRRYDLRTKKR